MWLPSDLRGVVLCPEPAGRGTGAEPKWSSYAKVGLRSWGLSVRLWVQIVPVSSSKCGPTVIAQAPRPAAARCTGNDFLADGHLRSVAAGGEVPGLQVGEGRLVPFGRG